MTIERSSITSLKGLKENNIKKAKWTILDINDDSHQLPKQPSGSYYNSLLRHESNTTTPSKSLTKSLYSVGFTSFKKGEVKGSFLAQIGSPVKSPGVIITRDLQQLLDSE
ncbi:LipL32 family surface lipoprotein [Vibrio sp. SCSIO 43153]|uniref:LipL32 family surface lipoprotein n=1 Tax=Vibrio sp. SCSIO 43153 TaxID=2819098 RepID=UPI0033655A9E